MTKILKIEKCSDCPNSIFFMDRGTRECILLNAVINTRDILPNCPLEDAPIENNKKCSNCRFLEDMSVKGKAKCYECSNFYASNWQPKTEKE